MYKINELATLSNISTRTLRYYDQIGLLKPSKINESNYRLYDNDAVDKLQTILFYKELGYDLKQIIKIVNNSSFDIQDSLQNHLNELMCKRDHIDGLIDLVLHTIDNKERKITMSDKEKFEAFKEKQIKDNMDQYGDELNSKYDPEIIKAANEKYKSKSKYQIQQQDELTNRLNETIKEAMSINDPCNEISQKMCELHKEWIMFYWPKYDKLAHYSLVEMYTQDERFTAYYDKIQPGAANFLFEAMKHYIK